MRPTDVCHPIELRAPAPRAFPARSRSFRCADTPWSLGLHAALPGDRTFHDVRRPLRRTVIERCSRSLLPHGLENRAWALSSHGADPIEPLTPVSRPSFTLAPPITFAPAAIWPPVLLLRGFERVGGV